MWPLCWKCVADHPYLHLIGLVLLLLLVVRPFWKNQMRSRPRALSVSSESLAVKWAESVPKLNPNNIINTAVYFDKLPEPDALRKLVKEKMLDKYERFHSIPVEGKWCWVWKPVETSVDKHMFSHTCANDKEVLALLHDLMVAPLTVTSGLPLWEMHTISNKSGQHVILPRVHHAIGDGIGLVTVMQDMITDAKGQPFPSPKQFTRPPGEKKSFGEKASALLSSLKLVLGVPVSPFDTSTKFNNPNPSKLTYSNNRRIVEFPVMDLTMIKGIKDAAKVTVNDVLMSLFSGAVARYCKKLGDPTLADDKLKSLVMRALLPVAFPRKNPAKALRNKWCFVSTKLAVAEKDALTRLQSTNKINEDVFKNKPTAIVQMVVQTLVANILPMNLVHKTAYDVFTRHSVVFSNVPGPAEPIYFAGGKVEKMLMLFPNLIPQVGILSYNGRVHMCVVLDDKVVTNPENLVAAFSDELKELCRLTSVEYK